MSFFANLSLRSAMIIIWLKRPSENKDYAVCLIVGVKILIAFTIAHFGL
jgi:hypothetical protein